MLPGITASGEFFHVAGSSLLNRCSISLEHCASSLIDPSRLIFWKRMHMSHNINLCILSRFVLNRFSTTNAHFCILHYSFAKLVTVNINFIFSTYQYKTGIN